MIEEAQELGHEADQEDVVSDLFDSDVLTGDYLAEVDFAAAEAGAAAARDGDGAVVERVLDGVEDAVKSGRGCVAFGRTLQL